MSLTEVQGFAKHVFAYFRSDMSPTDALTHNSELYCHCGRLQLKFWTDLTRTVTQKQVANDYLPIYDGHGAF